MNNFKVKIASYKNSKSFFGVLIKFKQKYLSNLPKRYARFSHSEIVFCYNDDKDILKRLNKIENTYFWKENRKLNTITRDTYFETYNLWFSSEEWTWSRFKFIEDNKNHWIFTDFEVSKEEYLKMLDFAIHEDNNSYNWLWIFFNQTLKLNWFRRKWDWFCSQITCRILQELCIYKWIDPINVSPWRLAEMWDNFNN